MLRQMRIQGLGVIDDAVLDLSDGLNVLTGETGAGKTMVISGLGLLLGARGDTAMVRADERAAVIEGLLDVPDGHPARERALDAGADIEDDLIISRTVSAEGRSRAHVGGRQTPVSVLNDIGEMLVAVHGQSDQWRLRRPEEHRIVLDDYGAATIAPLAQSYTDAYSALASTQAEIRQVTESSRDRAVEIEVLRRGLAELEEIDPLPGEDEELRAEDQRLSHTDALRAAAGIAHDALTGNQEIPDDGGAAGLLATARTALSGQSDHDEQLADLERRAAELAYLTTDLGAELAAYLSDVDADPTRLAAVQERRAALARLTRSYGDDIDQVLEWGRRAAARLDELEGSHDRIEALRAQAAKEQQILSEAATALSRARQKVATSLGRAVTEELAHLAMGRAQVDVVVDQQEDSGHGLPLADGRRVRCHPHGIDLVEIRLAANPGAPPRTVAKAASGGELSRVMLALEVVTGAVSEDSSAPRPRTFVFDEVDAGVGGKAALDVGARLSRLARHAQVIVVTHLPQVAAFADAHLVIHKSSEGQITTSGISVLDEDGRLRELARMMAGAESEVAVQHARELREQATQRAR
ncbi:DNA repair protein RecN (Recombination protein N) [Austwickia chelonae]|uniref:DNA repair protein RecN n=1 Tax=Austwickia chelonae NBRC 105200 TaxID=1184607 RepID=K6W7B7_9MICO|nr:DNA repair protein RecN [Austwickia chelonae]GAB77722.1 DNA repair protein RecN [Austwickia chelonae NBRC 105200]SEW16554.1 DNA repair protein RecN (Recombination protein N) [Austwickia chelonae]